MNAIILSIGDELILGQSVDTNSAYLSQQLAAMGVTVIQHVTIADDLSAIASQITAAADSNAEIVIATGGLGPTDDDLTRHAIAEALGVQLEFRQELLDDIEAFFDRLNRPMAEKNRVQAMIPQPCQTIDNPVGTASGIIAKIKNTLSFFLPGVPDEMTEMLQSTVMPQIRQMIRKKGEKQDILFTRKIHTLGTGESNVAQSLGPLMARDKNPLVNCTVSNCIITLRINATAPDEHTAKQMISPIEQDIHQRLGTLIFGYDDETLPTVTAKLLTKAKATLALAESCTGGLIAKMLTDIPGSSAFFKSGWIVYSNNAKESQLGVASEVINQHGAVSRPVAEQLAINARHIANTDYAIGITGIAGPTGASQQKPLGLVYIALADESGTIVEKNIFNGNRGIVRHRAALTALNMLRIRIESGKVRKV